MASAFGKTNTLGNAKAFNKFMHTMCGISVTRIVETRQKSFCTDVNGKIHFQQSSTQANKLHKHVIHYQEHNYISWYTTCMLSFGHPQINNFFVSEQFCYKDIAHACTQTREHDFTLVKWCKLDVRKYSSSQRTVNEWTKLSADCVHSSKIKMF